MIIVLSLLNKDGHWNNGWFLSNPVSGVSIQEKMENTFNTLLTENNGII